MRYEETINGNLLNLSSSFILKIKNLSFMGTLRGNIQLATEVPNNACAKWRLI